MSRRKLENHVYFPIGTVALPSELVEILKQQGPKLGGISSIVRACLIAAFMPEHADNQPAPIFVEAEATTEPSEDDF